MQEIIVAVIVLSACWFTLKRYLPRTVRLQIARRMAALCARCGWSRLEKKLLATGLKASEQGGCSNCSSCESSTSKTVQKKAFGITPEAFKNTIRR